MTKRITQADKADFSNYVHNCTDAKLCRVYERERTEGRRIYAQLAREEKARRGLEQ